MAVFLTGDTHNYVDIDKLVKFYEDGLKRSDYMIVLGDFGFVWSAPRDFTDRAPTYDPWQDDQRWLDWLEEQSYTTLWIDGNHENFDLLAEYPVQEWHGGRVQFIRDHVIHLMRGDVFDIDGRTFFAMGGAYSADRARRTPHKTWWPQEVPSAEERAYAEAQLEAAGWQVDYVITHAGPTTGVRYAAEEFPGIHEPDEYTDWLQTLADRLTFKRWFHAHYHVDRWWGTRYTCLYNDVFDLDDTGRTECGSSTDPFAF